MNKKLPTLRKTITQNSTCDDSQCLKNSLYGASPNYSPQSNDYNTSFEISHQQYSIATNLRAEAPPFCMDTSHTSNETEQKQIAANHLLEMNTMNSPDIDRSMLHAQYLKQHKQQPISRNLEQEHYAQELRYQLREHPGNRESEMDGLQYRQRTPQMHSPQTYMPSSPMSHDQILNMQGVRVAVPPLGLSQVNTQQCVMIPGVGLRLIDVASTSSQIGANIVPGSQHPTSNITSQYATASAMMGLGIGFDPLGRHIIQSPHQSQSGRLDISFGSPMSVGAGRSRELGLDYNIPLESADGYIYKIQFKRLHRYFLLGPSAPRGIKKGDFVKVEADRGEDLGIVCGKIASTEFREEKPTAGYRGRGYAMIQEDNKRLIRLATDEERLQLSAKLEEELKSLQVCREKVHLRQLPMLIKDAEYQFDHHKLTFFFEADRRIDFRELVSDLFALYKTRIWMQQIDTSFAPDDTAAYSLLTGQSYEDVMGMSATRLSLSLIQIQSLTEEIKSYSIGTDSSSLTSIESKSSCASFSPASSSFQGSPMSSFNSPYTFSPSSQYHEMQRIMSPNRDRYFGDSVIGMSPARYAGDKLNTMKASGFFSPSQKDVFDPRINHSEYYKLSNTDNTNDKISELGNGFISSGNCWSRPSIAPNNQSADFSSNLSDVSFMKARENLCHDNIDRSTVNTKSNFAAVDRISNPEYGIEPLKSQNSFDLQLNHQLSIDDQYFEQLNDIEKTPENATTQLSRPNFGDTTRYGRFKDIINPFDINGLESSFARVGLEQPNLCSNAFQFHLGDKVKSTHITPEAEQGGENNAPSDLGSDDYSCENVYEILNNNKKNSSGQREESNANDNETDRSCEIFPSYDIWSSGL